MTTTSPPAEVLEQLLDAAAEPLLAAGISRPDWPVVLGNDAFRRLAGDAPFLKRPLADVVEPLIGRELAVEVSETVRSGEETTIPVEINRREYALVVKPIAGKPADSRYYGLFFRRGGGAAAPDQDREMHQALLRAKRRIRDLSREDPVTGLLNEAAFREVLAHDLAVARREGSSLALVAFTLDDFERYVEVFGRHAADSCLRRVAQAIRRCLRRASDVAARIDGRDGAYLVVLSHGSDEAGVHGFAERIAGAVRELGLHHPRSRAGRFVTVSPAVALAEAGKDLEPDTFLERVVAPA